MAASINPHYYGLVDMGRYVCLKKRFLLRVTFLMPTITTAAGAFSAALYECGASLGIGWAVLPILS